MIQKEYPTACDLGKARRQHWDVAIVEAPPQSAVPGPKAYDYLRVGAAVEFGMNRAEQHLVDDMERLCHPDAHVGQGFVVHLYRLSRAGASFCTHDWSPSSARILTKERVARLSVGRSVEVYYGMYDGASQHDPGAWKITQGEVALLR